MAWSSLPAKSQDLRLCRALHNRKNYLFAGSDTGAERAAIADTLLGCCQLAEVDPVQYLADVKPRLSRRVRIIDLPALLPAPWKATRAVVASPQG